MRELFKCGIIHGVIFYQLVSPEVFMDETHFNIQNDIKAQVVDLSGAKNVGDELRTILNSAGSEAFGLSLVPSRKVAKNDDFFEYLTENAANMEILFVDEDILSREDTDFKALKVDVFLTLSPKTEPREYESKFYKYASLGIFGINFDIDSVTKGHLALCGKFSLRKCVHGIEFERQLEKAKSLAIDIALI